MGDNKKKTPVKIESELLFKSDMQCCICQKRGDHIHHLDGNRSNNNIENLVFLCFEHHDKASTKGSLSKKLSKEVIIKYRVHHYKIIETKRNKALGDFDNKIKELSEEKILMAVKNALIIIEIENLKEEYFNVEIEKRHEIVQRLAKYSNQQNLRLSFEVFEFLIYITNNGRAGLTDSTAMAIFDLVIEFFPSNFSNTNKKKIIQISKQSIVLGGNIAYDSFVYLKNISIAQWGLNILKYAFIYANKYKITEALDEIVNTFNDLETTLMRYKKRDLSNALTVTKVFRESLNDNDLSFPIMPDNIMAEMKKQETKSNGEV